MNLTEVVFYEYDHTLLFCYSTRTTHTASIESLSGSRKQRWPWVLTSDKIPIQVNGSKTCYDLIELNCAMTKIHDLYLLKTPRLMTRNQQLVVKIRNIPHP